MRLAVAELTVDDHDGGTLLITFHPSYGYWIWGAPKIRSTLLGSHINDYCILGHPYLGKLPFQREITATQEPSTFLSCVDLGCRIGMGSYGLLQ